MMSSRTRAFAAAAAVLLAITVRVNGSTPQFFQAASQNDFLKGELENLAIDARGQLLLGPAIEQIYEAAAPFLWALVAGPDGALYAGTGNEGRVFRVAPDGTASVFFDAAELEAHALAFAPDGGLYVGTSPDGKIYRVERNGSSRVFFEPEEKYIWALAVDRSGVLYAATGERGIVFRITPDGNGARFYQAKATHVTALALDPRGPVLVGTESPAHVLRVDGEGRAFLLLDSPLQEIRALRLDERGNLYAAAVSGPSDPRGAPAPAADPPPERSTSDGSAPVPSVSVEVTSVAVVDGGSGSSGVTTSRDDQRSARGGVYRIAPDGLWTQIWESREDAPYDLAFDAEDRVLVGTGPKGKIFRLEGTPLRPTLLTRAAAQQVMGFHRDRQGRLHVATSNPGKVFRLSSDLAARGTYESEPRDAGMVSSWGAITWRGTIPDGAAIELFTRSGNTATPDDTWSPWSERYTSRDGSAITSPKARYLQWRAVITRATPPDRRGPAASPVLTSVTAAYLQRNLAPVVRSVTLHPTGIVFQKPFSSGDPELAGFDQKTLDRQLTNDAMNAQGGSSSPQLGRRTYEKGLQTMVWRADDENDDTLSYELRYRREGETSWHVLRSGIEDPIFAWDTTVLPDGTYFVKVVASDAPSNAPAEALTGEMDSAPFEIDNTPPAITVAEVRRDGARTRVAFAVADNHAPIDRVEYSLDGVRWHAVFPTDGIADSRSERYAVTIEETVGPRGITLRAADAMHNVAAAHVEPPPATGR